MLRWEGLESNNLCLVDMPADCLDGDAYAGLPAAPDGMIASNIPA